MNQQTAVNVTEEHVRQALSLLQQSNALVLARQNLEEQEQAHRVAVKSFWQQVMAESATTNNESTEEK